MPTYVPRYLEVGRATHYVSLAEIARLRSPKALCGKEPLPFLNDQNQWQSNEDGLDRRPACVSCVKALTREGLKPPS